MIEWERVAELREEVGEHDFAEVVELFLTEVEDVLNRLRDAPERSTMERDLHFVRGSAMTLGFNGVSELCRTGEKLAAESRFEAIDLTALRASFERSRSEFVMRLS